MIGRGHREPIGADGGKCNGSRANVAQGVCDDYSLSAAMVARRLGLHGTERNWATITRLLSLASAVHEP